MDILSEWWAYLVENRVSVGRRTLEHLWLTGVSVALAILVGVLTGILLTRYTRWSKPVLGVANVVQTIPSIALLGFFIPLLGIGALPAIIALFLYALLPIIRNTYTGIQDVDPAIVEAGRGMGLTNFQLLTKVELPLALPTLFAGIRTAAVINVGVATLCALIAAGGLGEFIFNGIALNNSLLILTGAVPAALLAILLDAGLGLIQQHVRTYLRPILWGLGALLLFLLGRAAWDALRPQPFTAGLPSEFIEREDGWKKLKEAYPLPLKTVQMDAALMYDALHNGRLDVISGYSTDGRIQAFDLRVLEDDRNFFPPYFVAPLVRRPSLDRYPGLDSVLNLLAGRIPDSTMQRLNYEVDQLKRSPARVAEDFLRAEGFPTGRERNTGSPDLVIGAKNFTEQYILGELYARLIENHLPLDVELKSGLGGTQIVFNALLAGEVDLYPEYTGTGLLVLLDTPNETVAELTGSPQAVYEYVKEACRAQYGLIWLEPIGFNNSYALMMRNEQAEELGIETITELSQYLQGKVYSGGE